MTDFNRDLSNSISNAKKFISQALQKMYGNNAKIFSIEGENNQTARLFDSAGIDFAVKLSELTIGVNSRCHKWRDEKTITVREKRHGELSEYYRIKNSIEHGGIYPKLFAQAYINGDSAEVGIVETKKLFNFIEHHKVSQFHNQDVNFYSVKWKDLIAEKIPVFTYLIKNKKAAD